MGLLLLRLAAGASVLADIAARFHSGLPAGTIFLHIAAIATGILLMVGLWTPISASLLATFGIWASIAQAPESRANVLLITIGIALALLGPGVWSIDARLFGWKRIDLGQRDPGSRG